MARTFVGVLLAVYYHFKSEHLRLTLNAFNAFLYFMKRELERGSYRSFL
jgi:hypothetical protein